MKSIIYILYFIFYRTFERITNDFYQGKKSNANLNYLDEIKNIMIAIKLYSYLCLNLH